MTPGTACRLCGDAAIPIARHDGRAFEECRGCGMIQVSSNDLPAAETERGHYDLHENSADDPAYRRFLGRLASPLLETLPAAKSGLDFGCGPGPALAAMLEEAGHTMALYDPAFQPDTAVLERQYDFITCTETAEHFHQPGREFQRLGALLRPGGLLAVMTAFHPGPDGLAAWHYRRDPTHVCFYCVRTFEWLAAKHGWRVRVPATDVVFLERE